MIIGILAEDETDIAVIKQLIAKYAHTSGVKILQFGKGGCGKLKSKCRGWANNLADRGCDRLILVHDSDRNNPKKLRGDLTALLAPSPIAEHVIVIPVEEIEAWFLADPAAIKSALNIKGSVKSVASPESIRDPKEYLGKLVEKSTGKTKKYINAIHNTRIAKRCSLKALRKCASFLPFDDFISNHC